MELKEILNSLEDPNQMIKVKTRNGSQYAGTLEKVFEDEAILIINRGDKTIIMLRAIDSIEL